MKPNVEDVLAVELKREIAQRYFGFRKMIEEDPLDLTEKIKYQLSIIYPAPGRKTDPSIHGTYRLGGKTFL